VKHIIAVLLENEPGALSRVVALFSARGYNIETLTVAPTEDPSLSRMTIVTTGSDEVIEQITKHLNRLIEVVKVVDLTEGAYTERELMLIKVRAVGKERDEMKRMAEIFRGRIIDVTEKSYTVELTGAADKLDAFLQAIDRSANGPALECLLGKWRSGDRGVERAPSRGSVDASCSRNRLERRFPLRRHLREWSRRAPRPRAPYRREAWLDGPDAHVHRVSRRRNRCRRSSRRLP